ncbi:MAG: 4-hydroxythreonine-4-phosphate dehydrogenase PdxA [Pseudomonadota bacterium]|nr:4-hydroxythreonine-4-phosphate dehydrogenase PdxA [Pseudomonadota bacterium]
MKNNYDQPIAISMGEPGGINSEIILKTAKLTKLPKFFLVSDPNWVKECIDNLNINIRLNIIENLYDCKKNCINVLPIKKKVRFGYKKSFKSNVPATIESLNTAIKLAIEKKVSGIVTLPIIKETLLNNGFKYPGHTEYLGKISGKKPLMIMLNKNIKVATLTTHIPIASVPKKITSEALNDIIIILNKSLKNDFGIKNPKITISSLNPHNGENGEIGKEEINIIIPIVNKLRRKGLNVIGPKPADTMFHKEELKKDDAKLCMYHDQALIPIKSIDFYGSINFTAGLPFVRTSPDHGSAFDIAGEKKANNLSLINSIKYADKISKQRLKNG